MRRRLVSAFIVWHLTAIILVALPAPESRSERFDAWTGYREAVARSLDVASVGIAKVVDVARAAGGLVRPPVDFYIGTLSLAQQWAMFSNPPRYDEYVRVRLYVQPAAGRVWTATELVMPAGPEDRVRILQAYRDSYSDKAFAIALDGFYRSRKPAKVRPDTRPEELPSDLAPVLRYFTRRLTRRLPSDSRVVRTELWVGRAAAVRPGVAPDIDVLSERRAVLAEYYDGPIEERISVRPYPPYHGVEEEADIDWVLEYFEEP
jgi:hypothetical protein